MNCAVGGRESGRGAGAGGGVEVGVRGVRERRDVGEGGDGGGRREEGEGVRERWSWRGGADEEEEVRRGVAVSSLFSGSFVAFDKSSMTLIVLHHNKK